MRFGDEAKERVAADIGIGTSGQGVRRSDAGYLTLDGTDEVKKDGQLQ